MFAFEHLYKLYFSSLLKYNICNTKCFEWNIAKCLKNVIKNLVYAPELLRNICTNIRICYCPLYTNKKKIKWKTLIKKLIKKKGLYFYISLLWPRRRGNQIWSIPYMTMITIKYQSSRSLQSIIWKVICFPPISYNPRCNFAGPWFQ